MIDKIISSIRVGTASLVGMLLTWLAQWSGFLIDEETAEAITSGFQVFATLLFYILVRIVSTKFPWIELLLGMPQQPTSMRIPNV